LKPFSSFILRRRKCPPYQTIGEPDPRDQIDTFFNGKYSHTLPPRAFELAFFAFAAGSFIVHALRAMAILGSKAPLANDYKIVEPVLVHETVGFLPVQVMQDFFLLGMWDLFCM
jgi:hypothetical protein